jgi:hypothetical protein
MTLALSVPHLSLLQVVGIVVLAWIAMVLVVVGFGSRLAYLRRHDGVEPAAPSEPDELDGLFEDWPPLEGPR